MTSRVRTEKEGGKAKGRSGVLCCACRRGEKKGKNRSLLRKRKRRKGSKKTSVPRAVRRKKGEGGGGKGRVGTLTSDGPLVVGEEKNGELRRW